MWSTPGHVLILYCDGTDVIQLAGLVATIDNIGDVVITAAASGQMLRFNGASWVNEDPADATLADLSITFLGKRT